MDFYRPNFGYSESYYNPSALSKKNIVLDLDETLIHTFIPTDAEDNRAPNNKHHAYSLKEFQFIFNDNNYFEHRKRLYLLDMIRLQRKYGNDIEDSFWGFYRPHLREFLIFCKSYFNKIIIWTAGTYLYGHGICDIIFDGLYQPDLILTREDCETRNNNKIYKPLSKIYLMPQFRGIVTPENTLLIDDRASNFVSDPHNGIQIDPFDPEYDNIPIKKWLNMKDDRLLELQEWLSRNEVLKARDIRSIKKENIFA